MNFSKIGNLLFLVGVVLLVVMYLLNSFLQEIAQMVMPFVLPVLAVLGIVIGWKGVGVEKSQFFLLAGLAFLIGLNGFFSVFQLVDFVLPNFAQTFSLFFGQGLNVLVGAGLFVVGLKQVLASFE